jgi:hypothetical protein
MGNDKFPEEIRELLYGRSGKRQHKMLKTEVVMSFLTSEVESISTPQSRLELAHELFRNFHAQCFWNSPRDLEITDDLFAFVAKGLRMNGGHRGFMLAGTLRPNAAKIRPSAHERDALECR